MWAGPASVYGQQIVQGNSTDLVDAKALFKNPALVSFQRAKFFAGAKAYHLGLGGATGVPLRQGFVAASTPFLWNDYLGISAGGQYFDSPVFRRNRFGVRLAGRYEFASLGLEIETLTLGYNRANFTEEALNDPLFADGTSKTSVSLGAGLYAQPLSGLGVSLGVRNLNKPVTSLGADSSRARREFYGGVSYAVGAVRGTVELNQSELTGTTARLYLETFSTEGHYIRASSDFGFAQSRLEGQYHVGGPWSVNYSYDLPTSQLLGPSSGSHQFAVIYEFGRSPAVEPPPPLPPHEIPFGMAEPDAALMPVMYVTAEANYVEVFEKRIRRRIEPGLPSNALASLSRSDLDRADSTFAAYSLPFRVEPIRPVAEDVRFPTPISPDYRSSLEQISSQLALNTVNALNIVGREELVEKVMGLRNQVIYEAGAPSDRVQVGTPRFDSVEDSLAFYTRLVAQDVVPQEAVVYAEPGETTFHVYPFQIDPGTIAGWSLDVSDRDGAVIRSFSGQGPIAEAIRWDWRTAAGELVAPGVYYYRVTWQDHDGSLHYSDRSRLYVKKFIRHITIDVRKKLDPLETAPDQVQLLIKN